jgi:hypothetical protein
MTLISLVMARHELDLQWIQLNRLSAQYNQSMQELIDVLLQQDDAFNADFVRYFYEDPSDCDVLKESSNVGWPRLPLFRATRIVMLATRSPL